MPYWAAARLLQSQGRLALHVLGQRGFEVYQPRVRERRIVRGRKTLASAALFPGYAFIGIVQQWHEARWCPGVLGLVLDGNRPARVPDEEIERLRAREIDGFIKLPPPPPAIYWRRGEQLRIRVGPLIGFSGLCLGMRGRDRVRLLLEMLGTKRRVELPAGDVARVG